ncbi:MAG TPA: M14 metallopeptidase family protein, partial [Gemmatimonadaceae bacterium]
AVLPLAFAAATASTLQAQGHITTPKEFFGHNIGDDYFLPNYDQFMAYWHKIDGESDRMQVVEIGKSSEGRPQLAAIITAPENFKLLDKYKDISMKLAKGEGLTDEQAHALAKEGKAVVWFDGGLHATEVLGANQLIETSYQLITRNDEETKRILHDDIILAVHANPDGMQLVANWYMKDKDTLQRNMQIPLLYNKYAGHDDNRDSFMSNLSETRNINHFMFWEWHPVIMYNHHQTGPAGSVIFTPPFRDPFNYNFDPMIVMGLDMVGAAMHQRFLEENKPGFTMRSGSNYSTWWNGGLRTIGYFQGIIGILTEAIGNPTPERIPFLPHMQLPHGDLPAPVTPGIWHFRQSIDYSVTANYSIFDLASRYRETYLYDKYLMAKHAIAKGNQDTWTVTGKRIADAEVALDGGAAQAGAARGGRGGGRGAVGDPVAPFGRGAPVDAQMHAYNDVLHAKDKRDPRGYIIPSDQPDFPTAVRFVNTLRNVGVYVDQATQGFSVGGKQYPAGSFVLRNNQAARAQILDMMEPQDHPNDFAYPGGPPVRPYDNAGWTLAYTMGVKFDRILDPFEAPTRRLGLKELAKPLAGTVANASGAAGFLLTHDENDAVTVMNRVYKNGGEVDWVKNPITAGGKTFSQGAYYFPASQLPILQKAATELGVSFVGVTSKPDVVAIPMKRIALYDQYGGSMPSGWTRLEFENFEIPYTIVYPKDIDAGNLKSKFDVLILPSGAQVRGAGGANFAAGRGGGGRGGPNPATIPPEYQKMLGSLTPETSLPAIKQFLNDGGTVVTVGTATSLGYALDLPIENHLLVRAPGQPDRPLAGEEYYVPGSVLQVAVDNNEPVAAGLPKKLDVFFDNSPVFRLKPDAASKGTKAVAWFDSASPLRSGWAWGQNYLEGGAAVVESSYGKGKVYLFGPEITFRGQPHGTFKFLFNGIYAPTQLTPSVVP